MGNEEINNISDIKNKFYLHINLIGTNSDLINDFIKSFQIKNINENVATKKEGDLKNLFDYWDWTFNLDYSFENQCQIVFDYIEFIKRNNIESNECLVVKVKEPNSYQVKYILRKINEIIDKDYMPLTLFLCEHKIIVSKKDYPFIDPRIIHTEKFRFTGQIDKEPIYRTLMKFCSLYHELGDRFSVGKEKEIIDYCLINKIFPNNLNIICLGKVRQGKSTCINHILNEIRSRETDSGISQTKKMTYYQVQNYPIKILDFPGFENKETVQNAISELTKLKDYLNKKKDKIHIILYVLDFNSTMKFINDEFLIFKELINHEEAKIIYVFTKSANSKNKQMLTLKKTSQAINNLISIGNKTFHNIDVSKIRAKMNISEDNCVFVNFIEEDNYPKFGINELFYKIRLYYKSTESYRNALIKKSQKEIEKEAKELKEKAKEELLSHKIGGALIGAIPILDIITQKFLIKRSALNKISQIFGLDLNEIEEHIRKINKEELINEKDLCNMGKNVLSIAGNAVGASSIVSGSGEVITIITETILEKTTYIKFFSWELFKTTTSTVIDTSTTTARIGIDGLKIGLGVALSAIMSLGGIGLGAYFTTKDLNELVEKYYKAYLIYGPMLSNSYLKAKEYLEQMELNNY